jgi:hypothetical protein
MIDFAKLLDPVYIAQAKAEREAESQRLEEEAKRVRGAVQILLDRDVEEQLSDKERRFVRDCQSLAARQYVLTPRQQDWLFSLADTYAPGPSGDDPAVESEPHVPAP